MNKEEMLKQLHERQTELLEALKDFKDYAEKLRKENEELKAELEKK